MTHAHSADALVLEALVDRSYAYLGMMGSSSKVRRIFAALEEKGIAAELLDRVHAPIGVAIASHTPAEIAVSIAAEIISIRNRGGSG
jgi:xanthine dehydrogenase accessory factor